MKASSGYSNFGSPKVKKIPPAISKTAGGIFYQISVLAFMALPSSAVGLPFSK